MCLGVELEVDGCDAADAVQEVKPQAASQSSHKPSFSRGRKSTAVIRWGRRAKG